MNYTLHLPPNYTPPPLPGRDEWVAALRSGQYHQGKGSLFVCLSDPVYCCLGVLSSLQGRLVVPIGACFGRDGDSESSLSRTNPFYSEAGNFGDTGCFPHEIWIKLEDERDYVENLTQANDLGLSFAQIADIIEAVWSDGGPLLK